MKIFTYLFPLMWSSISLVLGHFYTYPQLAFCVTHCTIFVLPLVFTLEGFVSSWHILDPYLYVKKKSWAWTSKVKMKLTCFNLCSWLSFNTNNHMLSNVDIVGCGIIKSLPVCVEHKEQHPSTQTPEKEWVNRISI